MQGIKHDQGKPRVDLVPQEGILAAARAFEFGASKYSEWNWAQGMLWMRFYGAILRHLFAWVVGEENDAESGLSHLDHALASLFMLQAHAQHGLGEDNRPLYSLGEEAQGPTEDLFTPPGYVWRIGIRVAYDRVVESGYFRERRFLSREAARQHIDLAEIDDAHYVIEMVPK